MKQLALAIALVAFSAAACSDSGPIVRGSSGPPDCHDPNLTQADYAKYCAPSNLATAPLPPPSSPAGGVQTEGSVTTKDGSFVQYPDGGVVRITDVERVAGDRCYEAKATDTCLLVQVTLTNGGSAPIDFDGDADIELDYGANRYKADDATFMGDPGGVEFPKRCVPGSAVKSGSTFLVPTDQLDQLAVTFQASLASGEMYTPYTFTDVQTLIR